MGLSETHLLDTSFGCLEIVEVRHPNPEKANAQREFANEEFSCDLEVVCQILFRLHPVPRTKLTGKISSAVLIALPTVLARVNTERNDISIGDEDLTRKPADLRSYGAA